MVCISQLSAVCSIHDSPKASLKIGLILQHSTAVDVFSGVSEELLDLVCFTQKVNQILCLATLTQTGVVIAITTNLSVGISERRHCSELEKKQSCIALSTAEAGYMALSSAAVDKRT